MAPTSGAARRWSLHVLRSRGARGSSRPAGRGDEADQQADHEGGRGASPASRSRARVHPQLPVLQATRRVVLPTARQARESTGSPRLTRTMILRPSCSGRVTTTMSCPPRGTRTQAVDASEALGAGARRGQRERAELPHVRAARVGTFWQRGAGDPDARAGRHLGEADVGQRLAADTPAAADELASYFRSLRIRFGLSWQPSLFSSLVGF